MNHMTGSLWTVISFFNYVSPSPSHLQGLRASSPTLLRVCGPDGGCSVEAQTGAFGSLRGPDGLGDAPALRTQARPGAPAHALQHPTAHVGVGDRSRVLPDHG